MWPEIKNDENSKMTQNQKWWKIKNDPKWPSGSQWQSVAVSGSQWQSLAISGSQWQSVAVSGSQWQSMAVNGSQRQDKFHSIDHQYQPERRRSIFSGGTPPYVMALFLEDDKLCNSNISIDLRFVFERSIFSLATRHINGAQVTKQPDLIFQAWIELYKYLSKRRVCSVHASL